MKKKKKRLVLVIEERVRYFYHLEEGENLDEAREDAWKAYGEGALKGEFQDCNIELIEEDD